MNKKKVFLAVLALILVCSLSVAGTLAYLTATQQQAVVNTFVAASGGIIIPKPGPTPTPTPDIPDELNTNFFLVESPATYADGNYTLSTTAKKVITNNYDKVVPSMTIPKDPALTINLAKDIDAYIFVKVVDTTNGNLIYTMDTARWEAIDATNHPGVYVYINDSSKTGNAKHIVTGNSNDEYDLTAVNLFPVVSDTTSLFYNMCTVKAADTLNDTDDADDGMQLGKLTFYAYACQAGGFASAAEAFTSCFGSNP